MNGETKGCENNRGKKGGNGDQLPRVHNWQVTEIIQPETSEKTFA